MYLPTFKYKGNLYTQGEEYSIEGTNESYVGNYFTTYSGDVFTGNKPGDGPNSRLVRYIQPTGGTSNIRPEQYDIIRQKDSEVQLRDTAPVPLYYPKPGNVESFTRYFAIDKSTKRVVEVSKDVYLSMKSKEQKYYYPKYELKTLDWSLRSVSDNRINTAIAGLESYLKDPSQFVR